MSEMALDSIREIIDTAAAQGMSFWEAVLASDMDEREVSRQESLDKMAQTWRAMRETDEAYRPSLRSASGLVGGDGEKMRRYAEAGVGYSGGYLGEVIATALRSGESNACMCRIVAAPTAGACGVLPAVLIPTARRERIPDEEILKALYVAAGIGAVVSFRASISGAFGGCQAEIGTAAAMAAGALVCLHGGTDEQIGHAVAMALANLMGLICDPVAGLVEVPCVRRNVIGAMDAVSAADMALAGITSQLPVDQVIVAMGEVGRRMPVEFRETGLGGLAATPFAREISERFRAL